MIIEWFRMRLNSFGPRFIVASLIARNKKRPLRSKRVLCGDNSMKKVLLILLVFLALPFPAAAEKSVSLLIWVEDAKAFNKENYRLAVREYERQGVKNLRTIYIRNNNVWMGMYEQTDRILKPTDKVSTVILASHGTTRLETNQTSLSKLGRFGEDGLSDRLRYILEWVEPYLGNKVHFYLESCKTMCGEKSDITRRVEGLHSELQRFGIQEVSVWGATTALRSHKRKHLTELESITSETNPKYSNRGYLLKTNSSGTQLLVTQRFDPISLSGPSCQMLFQ